MDLSAKQRLLEDSLRSLGRTLVAYSGGVDSAYLAWVANKVLDRDACGDRRFAQPGAHSITGRVGVRAGTWIAVEVIQTSEMDRPEYVRNDRQRCFHCKDELFQVMEAFAAKRGFQSIAYGVNVDDQSDFRPGQAAARQHQVAAPLLQAGLTKADIRELARAAGLRVWEKPASACLSSRIEYGRPVTLEALSAVEQGEEALRRLGFRQCRVRHHGEIARIEIARDELPRALTPEMFPEFTQAFKALGFTFVTIDTEGFRSGSMNAAKTAPPLIKLIS